MSDADKKTEVVIEIEYGMVVGVYSTSPGAEVCILDMDTSDTERYEELEKESDLHRRVKAGDLVSLDFRETR